MQGTSVYGIKQQAYEEDGRVARLAQAEFTEEGERELLRARRLVYRERV
ncbi:MAG: hypothetical protein IPF82_17065 [Blastocatellia bacterium]|nr:hypothetical protein [Blastocatellia bacterium]